jgi:hypothetical protein
MGQKARQLKMKALDKIFIPIFSLLLASCAQKSSNADLEKLLKHLKIDTNISITDKNEIIERDIPYDTLKKEINLYKFNEVQKALITNRLKPLSQNINYGAYLYLSKNLISKIYTLVIYTDSDLGHIIYLVNYNDTVLVDYLYNEGNYGYLIDQDDEKEIIEGFNRHFEFHHDTVFKINNRIVKYNFLNEARKTFKYTADSIITKYKIEQNGKFTKIYYDSIPGVKPELLTR